MKCDPGFKLGEGQCHFQNENPHCTDFEGDACVGCIENFALEEDICVENSDENCLKYEKNTSNCIDCKDTFKPGIDGVCALENVKDDNCIGINDEGDCIRCVPGIV